MQRKPMTLTQKILAAHAVGLERPWVQAGDVLRIRVDWTIASELAWNGMDRTYTQLGRPPLADANRFFLAVDHTVDPTTLARDPRAQKLAALSRSFAKERGVRHFYDSNVTILHTKFYRDLVLPGDVVLGADSHTSSHGGMGAFSIGLGGADVTAAMVLGQSWIEVPEAIAIDYTGAPGFGIGGKDIILRTLAELKRNTVAMERTVEYRGEITRGWSTDVRFTICNMTAEFGGLNGIFEPDPVVADWIARRAPDGVKDGARYHRADDLAPYVSRHEIKLGLLEPLIAVPFSPDNVVPVSDEAGRPMHGAFIGACTTTEEELVLGALVLEAALAEGQAVAPGNGANRIVVPGDLTIQRNLREAGLWNVYERAGFVVDPPGCSMCLGVASRKANKDEVWLSSQNRNYKNRMGEGSLAYLASAATVAASSVGMKITDPRRLLDKVAAGGGRERMDRILGRAGRLLPVIQVSEPEVHFAMPPGSAPARIASASGAAANTSLAGRVQRFGDHVDTDAIIPGEFCHLVDPKELGAKCFHFVRPEFVARAQAGQTIVVAGEAWGSGSSREQAVWALLGAGVRAVIAKSFAFIHKRNLVNEALPFLIVDDPEFYEAAVEDAGVTIDFEKSCVVVGERAFHAGGATPMIQALARAGGLVPAIQRHGQSVFGTLAERS
jgi:aconitate hydratase/homoaconitate hydratase